MRTRTLPCVLILAFFSVWPSHDVQIQSTPAGPSDLRALKNKTGGEKWDTVTALSAEGEKASFGLTGLFHQVEDFRAGRFESTADYHVFANAEGRDLQGRWRQDNSGGVHPLDSGEARAVAVSETYLAGRGYLFPDRSPATFHQLDPKTEGPRHFARIAATPENGRTITLWIDSATSLLDRAVIDLSVGSKVVRYSDYRAAGDLTLPFSITIEHRGENETGIARIAHYDVRRASAGSDLTRPESRTGDLRMAGNVEATSITGRLHSDTGFLVVDADINGRGPLPFILDTGGHDILTPAAARDLKLHTVGAGISTGAGAGTTATEFTSVDTLTLGAAIFSAQPFTVLHLDLGSIREGKRTQPIAGILGLEIFERCVVTIDYATERVTLAPLAQFTAADTARATPLRFTDDMPLVPATLDGHSGWFGVDTGNNERLIVFQRWAESNGIASRLTTGASLGGTSVGGHIDLRLGRADAFALGPGVLTNVDILLAGEDAGSLSARFEAGNFGNAILSRFRVTFDYRHELMILEPESK